MLLSLLLQGTTTVDFNTTVLVALFGGVVTIITAVIALFTLLVARKTHDVANSRLTETINKVDALTALNTELKISLNRSQQTVADNAAAAISTVA